MTIFIAGNDVTDYCTSIKISQKISTLGKTIKILLENTDNTPSPDLGDRVSIDGDANYFVTGFSVGKSKTDVTASDACYYLNKSKITLQLESGSTVTDAIVAAVRAADRKFIYCPLMKTELTDLFYAKTPAEIIRTCLDRETDSTGTEYFIQGDTYGNIEIRQVGYIRSSITLSGVIDATRTRSLDDVRNAVTVILDWYDAQQISDTVRDEASIAKYGLLSETAELPATSENTVVIAHNRLARLSRIGDSVSITVTPANTDIRVGTVISVSGNDFEMPGDYTVSGISHDYSGGESFSTISLTSYFANTQIQTVLAERLAPDLTQIGTERGIITDARGQSYRTDITQKQTVDDILRRILS